MLATSASAQTTVTITVLSSEGPAAERPKPQHKQKEPGGIRGFFARLFGRSQPQPAAAPKPQALTLPLRAVKRTPPDVPEDVGRKIKDRITVRMRASVSERGRLLRVDRVGRNEG